MIEVRWVHTDYVAWCGVIIAISSLGWNITTWFKSGPKIKHRIKLNTSYPDAKILKVEKTKDGESRELAAYCHIELINGGKQATTIMDIEATHESGKNPYTLSMSSVRFLSHFGKNLPNVLYPGEVWSCRFEMEDLYRLAEYGQPQINIVFSHLDRPMIIKPKVTRKQETVE